MFGRWWAVLALVGLLLPGATTARQATPVAGGGPIVLPTPTGPFAVGRTLYDWTDEARVEPATGDQADRRALVVWLWYPAAPVPAADPAAYLPGRWAAAVAEVRRYDPARVRAHAVAGAPVAASPPEFAVVVLSPGNGGIPADYTALAAELASHGYVVAAITHAYNAAVTVFTEGGLVRGAFGAQLPPGSLAMQAEAGARISDLHAADIRFVFDQLETLNAGSSPFRGRLDLDRIGVVGASLGGSAGIAACRTDRRCRAVANLDGGLWGAAATDGAPVPTLLVASDHLPCDELAADGEEAVAYCRAVETQFAAGWARAAEAGQPGSWLAILGSRHAGFSDAPFLAEGVDVYAPLVAGQEIAPGRLWRVTSDLLLAFFDRALRGMPAPLLDGPSPAYPEVVFVDPGAAGDAIR